MAKLGGVPEARIEDGPHGRAPAEAGWWTLNLGEMAWQQVDGSGTWCVVESPAAPSATLGIGVHILFPGDTPGKYHAEDQQQGFLVLEGECLAIVEGEERHLGRWDYLHCPPGTAHITVGAQGGPCALLMVGTRAERDQTLYLPDPVAARHGAAVERETASAADAYAGRPPFKDAPSPWPLAGS